ncbi:Glycosyltransferase, GT2 family [Novosphingobium sp. CF614]|uniref:glycosyltransferase n=1 Tax=Novosphingobium sp. CF614 TaxID=1884364 RepID=UPI0008E13F53|nr:glycosyltransferase [Novosphingobium sp. CF614]SFG20534.1 Glycosyltransferase, GT2 family [Novosphingobium sp. CF614]
MRILAAVVTHNRCALLERCIDHITGQTRPPDGIVVINNASTDGTVAMLDSKGIAHIDQANLGSAGGWNRAITACLEGGFEAVWLMDDDGFPDATALAALEQALAPGIACVSSVVLREDMPSHFVFPVPLLNSRGLPIVLGRRRKLETLAELSKLAADGSYPFAHFFNGALIARPAIEAAGTVDTRYFMFGDEVDYFFRLRQIGEVRSVLAARHYHPDVTRRPLTPTKLYYYLKNTLVLNERYFDKVLLRNLLTLAIGLTRYGARNGWSTLALILMGRQRRLVPRAVMRGLRGQVGADFDG